MLNVLKFKIMKNLYLFILAALVIGFSSCEKDSIVQEGDDDSTALFARGNSQNPLESIESVSGWLKFQDQKHYDECYAFLYELNQNYSGSGGDDNEEDE